MAAKQTHGVSHLGTSVLRLQGATGNRAIRSGIVTVVRCAGDIQLGREDLAHGCVGCNADDGKQLGKWTRRPNVGRRKWYGPPQERVGSGGLQPRYGRPREGLRHGEAYEEVIQLGLYVCFALARAP